MAVGDNFGAGFTGGQAFVYDADDTFERRVNPDTLGWTRVVHPHWQGVLHDLVQRHAAETQSKYADMLLHDWVRVLPKFWQVVPKEYAKYLPVPVVEADALRA